MDIAVAPHREVFSALELHDAVAELGYPCVVKPPHGRGSSGVSVLDNADELRTSCGAVPSATKGGRIRGWSRRFCPANSIGWTACVVTAASCSRLSRSTSTHTLTSSTGATWARSCFQPRARKLKASSNWPGPYWKTDYPRSTAHSTSKRSSPPMVRCSAKSGRGSAADPFRRRSNSPTGSISSRSRSSRSAGYLSATPRCANALAGQLNISPVSGVLTEAPEGFEHPDVVLSEIAEPGRQFSAMTHTNAEFARAVFRADSVESGLITISKLLQHIDTTTKWKDLIMWRQLDQEDYEAVLALRDAVLGSLPDSDMYVREDDEEMFVRGHLNVFGESLGFFDGNDLVAYLALTTDLVASGEDVEFEACTPTSNDVVFAAAMVLPSYQGRSLHRAGIHSHIAAAEPLGAHRGFAQISARNHRSLRNYFSHGFGAHRLSPILTVAGDCFSNATWSVTSARRSSTTSHSST